MFGLKKEAILSVLYALILAMVVNGLAIWYDPWSRLEWLIMGILIGAAIFFALWLVLGDEDDRNDRNERNERKDRRDGR